MTNQLPISKVSRVESSQWEIVIIFLELAKKNKIKNQAKIVN